MKELLASWRRASCPARLTRRPVDDRPDRKITVMATADSVSTWIANLKAGEAGAADQLWNRYAERLLELARRKLGDAPKGHADEEDIAQSVFGSICRGAAAGRFGSLSNRDDLWWILLTVTKQKAVDHIRRERAVKRGGGRVQSESGLCRGGQEDEQFVLDHLIGDEPTAELLAVLQEQNQRLMSLLRDDRLRQIAIFRIEGYTVPEIAESLGVSLRSVERKLKLIRSAWTLEIARTEISPIISS